MPKTKRNDLDRCDEDIAKLYLKTAAQQLKKMLTAMRSKSLTEVQRLSHKLSGSSGFLELGTMASLLSEVEKAASINDHTEAGRLLNLAKNEFEQIQRYRASKPIQKQRTQKVALAPASKKKFKIFLVDDHPLILEGLERLLNLQPDLKLVGQASSAHEALKSIPLVKPDLVILDITLEGSDGMGLIKDMKLRSLKSFVLVLSMHEESLYAERALKAGAQGYIMKHQAPKELLKAVHRILSGEIYLSEKMEAKMLHKIADNTSNGNSLPEGSLSDRELQVFQSIGRGRGTRQIAEELNISPKTVESYRAHIKVKMNLKNAHELTQHAVHWVEGNHLN